MASPVVSLTSSFSSLMNKAYKSATQEKLHSSKEAGFIKNYCLVQDYILIKILFVIAYLLYCHPKKFNT